MPVLRRVQLKRAQEEVDAGQGQTRQLLTEQAAGRRDRQRLQQEVERLGSEGEWGFRVRYAPAAARGSIRGAADGLPNLSLHQVQRSPTNQKGQKRERAVLCHAMSCWCMPVSVCGSYHAVLKCSVRPAVVLLAGASLVDALSKAQQEITRLLEWQDIFKRCEADKLEEAAQRVAVLQQQIKQQDQTAQQRMEELRGGCWVGVQDQHHSSILQRGAKPGRIAVMCDGLYDHAWSVP